MNNTLQLEEKYPEKFRESRIAQIRSLHEQRERDRLFRIERDHAKGRHDVIKGRWKHSGGANGNYAVPGCRLCSENASKDCGAVATALANIFNPRPADYIPRGFRKANA